MIKKLSLLSLMMLILGAGTYALAYIPEGVNNCSECYDYWSQRTGEYDCETNYLRCSRYFECTPC